MGKIRKVYLPKWVVWFTLLIVFPIWAWITYLALYTEKGRAEMGLGGWLIMTIVMAAVAVMVFLMSYGKRAVYLIEEEED